MEGYDYFFKFLIIGNSGVGKSSFFRRFTKNEFSYSEIVTIGVDMGISSLKIFKKNIKLQIWDTSGLERFRKIISSYYRGAQGVIIMYDITDLESFQNLDTWLLEIEKNVSNPIYKILVGNKYDMEKERKVSKEQGEEYAFQHDMRFFETSAKD